MSKANGKKSKKKLFIFGGLAILILAAVLLAIFGGSKEKIISVQIEKVEKRDITQKVTANGKINPIEKVVLRPEVTGEVVELPVKEGDKVKKGQLLIRLKPDQYIARRNKAEASLNYARATLREREASLTEIESKYRRAKELYDKQLGSEADLEQARSAYLRTKSQVEAQRSSVMQAEESYKDAKVELAKTVIYSPLDGTISVLNVEKSERVLGSSFSQGTHLMTVADLSTMEAVVEVDENDVVLISLGDTAYVSIDAFKDKKFKGIVSQIGNSAKTTGLGTQNEVVNFEIKIKLVELNDRIRPGMSCDAEILTDKRNNVLTVPIQSVTVREPKNIDENSSKKDKEPMEVVFVEEDNLAKMKKVKTGISDETYMEIINGLEEGENVIVGPYRAISKELEDSSKVRIMKKKKGKKNKEEKSEE